MKKKLLNSSVPALMVVAMMMFHVSCKKSDDLNIPLRDLGGDTWAPTNIDKWLQDSILMPYNIEVKYKSDISENTADPSVLLGPPSEKLVIPYMSMVKRIWLHVYDSATESMLFMQRYAPKTLLLIGSPDSKAAGVAEGDAKIILFNVNAFDPSAPANDIAALLHHEFTHILAGAKGVPQAFKLVTPADYAGGGWEVAPGDPYSLGFVSAYARKNFDEDLAETVSTLLVKSDDFYNHLKDSTYINSGGAAKLKQKEAIVVEFFSTALGIDFYKLQAITKAAVQ